MKDCIKNFIAHVLHQLDVLRQAYNRAKHEIEYGFYDDDRR